MRSMRSGVPVVQEDGFLFAGFAFRQQTDTHGVFRWPQAAGFRGGKPTGSGAFRAGSRRISRLVREFVLRGIAPQALQAIELALLVGKDVDHEIDVVQQDPFRRALSLDVGRPCVDLAAQPLLDARPVMARTCRSEVPWQMTKIVGDVA